MQRSRAEHLKELDFSNLWHPFTQHRDWITQEPLIAERGEGFELIDVEGKRYLDGISALWCNVHGYNHPRLLKALQEQAGKLCHSTLLGQTHAPVLELSEELLKLAPEGLTRIFFSDSGSAAVEAAIRISLEYQQKRGETKRTRLVSLVGGYHGDTMGSVGLGYLEAFHRDLKDNLIPSIKLPSPHVLRFYEGMNPDQALASALEAARALFEQHGESIAALVIEPLVQGAAGIWDHPPEFLRGLEALCRAHGALLVCDEVATGFGKTGRMFAVELAGVKPDMMVLGKSITAGYLPLSAVLAREEIFAGFLGEPSELKTFFFGQTFSGNPLACAVALENLKLIKEEAVLDSLQQRLLRYYSLLAERIAPLPHVDEIRTCGLMTGIELTRTPGKREAYDADERIGIRIVKEAKDRNLIIRPLGNVMVLMPALTMPESLLEEVVSRSAEAISAACG